MTEEETPFLSLDKTLYFTSLKNSSFDYSLPIKKNMTKFINENRIEASPYLFEYLCYKMAKNKLEKIKQINEEISIISEKYLSSEISNKSESIKKKYVFVPIRNSISRKWNAVIFIHLEKQIEQYMNQINEEPIIAKIISSNINSEEDDYILNTTMDRIESTFNFSSPEDIQFEVDSINISDQPNTSIFLLNFIEGLIEQKTDEEIMAYIMKLYDESSNTNIIGSNNYFMSFNKENELFKDILQIYEKELEEYIKSKGEGDNNNGNDNEDKKLFKLEENEEEIDSEEEALKIIAKENEEIRKQMEEQEIVFNMKINDPNYRLESDEFKNRNNILGQIQEVDNESDDESDKKSNLNNKSLKLSKSLRKKSENNIFNDDKIKNSVKEKLLDLKEFENIKINEKENLNDDNNNIPSKDMDNNEQNLNHFNKEDSIEIKNSNIQNIENKQDENKKENEEQIIKSEESNEMKEETNIIIKNDSINLDKDNKIEDIKDKEKEENKKINENEKMNSINIEENNDLKIDKLNNIDNINSKEEIKIIVEQEKNNVKKEDKEIKNEEDLKNLIKFDNNTNSIENKANKLKYPEIQNEEEKEKEKENISINIVEKNVYNSFEKIIIPKSGNKTIEVSSSDINIKNNSIKEIHNSINDNTDSNLDNNSVYEKKKIYQKRNSYKKKNASNVIDNKYNNTCFYISKGTSKDKKENSNKNNINNIIVNKEDNKKTSNNNENVISNDRKNIIFNKKNCIGKYKPKLPLVKNNIKNNTNINNNKNDNEIYKNNNMDYNNFEKNTIIINESSNNKTVINIIGIKNNYNKTDDSKEPNSKNKKNENTKENNGIINNQNQIWNINISNNNKINLINNENEESEYLTKIPDDGIINHVSSTLRANNTISTINNNENKAILYLNKNENQIKLKTEPDEFNRNEIIKDKNNDNKTYQMEPNEEKLDTDNELTNKQGQIRIDDEFNIDVNSIVNSNKNRIQRITTKKRTKNNNTYGFIKEYETNDCAMDFTKDLKCGCSGGSETGCNIF